MPGEGKAQQPKELQIRILGEKMGERRLLAWASYRYGKIDLQMGFGRSPAHVSLHGSGVRHLAGIKDQQTPPNEPYILLCEMWRTMDLRDWLTAPGTRPGFREMAAQALCFVDNKLWTEWPLWYSRKRHKVLSVALDSIDEITIDFWVADIRNRVLPVRAQGSAVEQSWQLDGDLLLILRAELEPEKGTHAV